MFDFDAGKFLIIGVVALIVIGPKELPRVLRQVGQTVGRVRRMAAEFQGQFMDAMKEADLESIRQDLKKIGDEADAELKVQFDPARDIQRELTSSLEAPAAANAVPALVEGSAAPTDGFALPAPEPPAEEPVPLATAIAPVTGAEPPAPAADGAPVDAARHDRATNGASPAPALLAKRKILVPKRRLPAAGRVHPVSDRTMLARRRPARPGLEELAER